MNAQKKVAADWRVKAMAKIRSLIKQADPKATVEQKYKMASQSKGIPVWYHDGMICTGETYKEHLRLTFRKAKALKKMGHKKIFNAFGAIIIKEGDKLNETAFKKLIKAAVALNQENSK